jgi:hypothetical protein
VFQFKEYGPVQRLLDTPAEGNQIPNDRQPEILVTDFKDVVERVVTHRRFKNFIIHTDRGSQILQKSRRQKNGMKQTQY